MQIHKKFNFPICDLILKESWVFTKSFSTNSNDDDTNDDFKNEVEKYWIKNENYSYPNCENEQLILPFDLQIAFIDVISKPFIKNIWNKNIKEKYDKTYITINNNNNDIIINLLNNSVLESFGL